MNKQADRHGARGCLLAACAAALALAQLPGCGGSGGVDSGGTGMDTPTLAIGPISGLGSIVVNGVHYDETAATVVDVDGQPLSRSALTLDSMTRVDASSLVDAGTRVAAVARTIQVTEALVGPVESVDTTAGTVFEASLGHGLASLRVGDVVAVLGQVDRVGARIVATRIEPRGLVGRYVMTAAVAGLDRTAQRLGLGTLTVRYDELGSLPAGVDTGSVVRAQLRTTATAGVWAATALKLNEQPLPDRDTIEVEGRVTAFTSAQRFSLDGTPVDASAATFSGGTVALGKRVEVDGRSVAGTIIARKVSIDEEDGGGDSVIELEGLVTALDLEARTFVVRSTTVRYDDSTRFDDGTAADLALNRKLSVKGRPAAPRLSWPAPAR
jgi:hypothetical protein